MKKLFIVSALALSACSSHNDDPSPAQRQTVSLVAVTVTGLGPLSQRPDLSVRVGAFTSQPIVAAGLPARFWIPGSYKGNQPFTVVLLNKGQVLASVAVDPAQFGGNRKFNVGSGATDLTIEVAY